MECGYGAVNETLFTMLRNAHGKGTLELDQPRPINSNLIGTNPVFSHAPVPIEDLCSADEHLLGVTPAQAAGASERSRINDGTLLSGFPASQSRSCGGRPGTDHVTLV